MKTRSAAPEVMISLACWGSVIIPTAPVPIPDSRRIVAAKGTW